MVDAEREREHQRTIDACREAEDKEAPRPFLPDPSRGEGARDPRANVLADTILAVHLKEVSATRSEIDRLLAEADASMDDKAYRDVMIRVAATAQEIAARIDRVRLR